MVLNRDTAGEQHSHAFPGFRGRLLQPQSRQGRRAGSARFSSFTTRRPSAAPGGHWRRQRRVDGPISDYAADVTATTTAGITVKENDWVALCNENRNMCRWYRVASVGDDDTTSSDVS